MAFCWIDFRRIGHDQVHVQLDDVAEAVADRAGAERVVEREQPRLRHLVLEVAARGTRTARRTGGPTGSCRPRAGCNGERGAAPFGVGGLDRVGEPRADVVVDLHAIDDHLQRRPIPEPRRVDVFQRHGPAVEVQAAEALAPQRRKRLGNRIDEIGQDRLRRARSSSTVVADALFFVAARLRGSPCGADATTGMSNPISSRVPGRQRAQPGRDDLRRSRGSTSLPQDRQKVRPTRA